MTYIDELTEIQSCFDASTKVLFFETNLSICVNLSDTANDNCDVLPAGLNVTIETDNLGSYIPITYIYDFVYGETLFFCFDCSDYSSTSFWLSTVAEITLSSYAYYTVVNPGLLYRVQADETRCFHKAWLDETDDFQSVLQLYKNEICFLAAINDNCDSITGYDSTSSDYNKFTVSSVRIELTFSDADSEQFELNGTNVNFERVTYAGTSGDLYYFKSCYEDTSYNFYDDFAFQTFYTAEY
jgi:hypothetical protein